MSQWATKLKKVERSELEGTHFEVIDMIKALDSEDCKLVEEVFKKIQGIFFFQALESIK